MPYRCHTCRMQYLVLSPKADTIVPLFGDTFLDEPLPANGCVASA